MLRRFEELNEIKFIHVMVKVLLISRSLARVVMQKQVARGCAASVGIGVYNTCANGCIYCYANYSAASVERNRMRHNPYGEFLLERM